MNSPALACTSSADRPGRYSADPMPKPVTPASNQLENVPALMPPTGRNRVPAGNTLRHAQSTAGENPSAGKIFKASAPARSAMNPSEGVATPGIQATRARLAVRMISGSTCGVTISRPPTRSTSATEPCVSTVPAPTTAWARAIPKAVSAVPTNMNVRSNTPGLSTQRVNLYGPSRDQETAESALLITDVDHDIIAPIGTSRYQSARARAVGI
jgi:hypothetical protein